MATLTFDSSLKTGHDGVVLCRWLGKTYMALHIEFDGGRGDGARVLEAHSVGGTTDKLHGDTGSTAASTISSSSAYTWRAAAATGGYMHKSCI